MNIIICQTIMLWKIQMLFMACMIRWSLKARELCSCNTTNWCTMIVTLLYFVLLRSAVVEGVSSVYFLMFKSSKNWKFFTDKLTVSRGYMILTDPIVIALTQQLNEKVGLKMRFEWLNNIKWFKFRRHQRNHAHS